MILMYDCGNALIREVLGTSTDHALLETESRICRDCIPNSSVKLSSSQMRLGRLVLDGTRSNLGCYSMVRILRLFQQICVSLSILLLIGCRLKASFVLVFASLSSPEQVVLCQDVSDSAVVNTLLLDHGLDRLPVEQVVIDYGDALASTYWWTPGTSLRLVAENILAIPSLRILVLVTLPTGTHR